MADETPPYDPCAAFIALRNAYNEALTSGGTLKRVRYKNGEDERETEFNPTSIKDLKTAMDEAQRQCLAQTSGRPARSAIGIGRNYGPGRIIY